MELAETLTPEAYTSERFFALERERVFASSWIAVGCAAQLREPGDVLVGEVAGRSLFVVRSQDGELRAFYNTCRHRGTRLLAAGERRVTRFIRCPYHSWAYDLDGAASARRCSRARDPRGPAGRLRHGGRARVRPRRLRAAARRRRALGPARVREPRRDRRPAVEQLGDLPARTAGYRLDEWELARVAEYDIAANYKLVGENFMEYYHLPWVHPGLVKVSPMEAHHRWQGTGMYMGFCTSPIAQDTDEVAGRGACRRSPASRTTMR